MADNVNREGLDYRAGWCEALLAFARRLQVEGARAKKSEMAGLELASRIGQQMHAAMLEKMRGTPAPPA